MNPIQITPENTEFVILSFEGPDLYSLAGGLGVRVTNLSYSLSEAGFKTNLFYVGDPELKGIEYRNNGNLILHRWCQWISKYHQYGVYEGEHGKLYDYNESIPPFLLDNVILPAISEGKMVVIMGEEWHTAEVMCRIHSLLTSIGLRDHAVLFWNANNTYSFEQIDWNRLQSAATITTVSRYMKQIMKQMGLNPIVVTNGIPAALLNKVDETLTARFRQTMAADLVISKIARWDRDKQWESAIEATARLKARGLRTILLARGGIEPYGNDIINQACSLGLKVHDVWTDGEDFEDYFKAVEGANSADILNIRFHCPQALLRIFYNTSDAVLANSVHEPFGLVGLEAMAAEGIVFTGGTGEDYAIPFYNSFVLETQDPAEIETYVHYISNNQVKKTQIRQAAKETASLFTWPEVIKNLLQRIEYHATKQGLLRTTLDQNKAIKHTSLLKKGIAV